MAEADRRCNILEMQVVELKRRLADASARIDRAELMLGQRGGGAGGGGGASAYYVCMTPASGSWEATGTWPTSTPGSFTADVYKVVGGAHTLVVEDATIYNDYFASPANSKLVTITPCGDGSFGILGESCV